MYNTVRDRFCTYVVCTQNTSSESKKKDPAVKLVKVGSLDDGSDKDPPTLTGHRPHPGHDNTVQLRHNTLYSYNQHVGNASSHSINLVRTLM
jgi:hypothetical protein